MKFISRVLSYFNFNFKQSLTSPTAKVKVDKLISAIPSAKQLIAVLRKYPAFDKEKIIYKVVIDMLEAHCKEFEGPLFKNLINKVIPLALLFYQRSESEEIDILNI